MKNLFLFLLFFVAILFGFVKSQNYETGDNSTIYGCSMHCSIEDETLNCWNETLSAFERFLFHQIKNYIYVQTNINQWHRRHDSNYSSNFQQIIKDSNQTMQSYLKDEDLVDSQTLTSMILTLISPVEKKSNEIIDWVWHYTCPIPCERFSHVWRNVFFGSLLINLMCIGIIFFYLIVEDDDVA